MQLLLASVCSCCVSRAAALTHGTCHRSLHSRRGRCSARTRKTLRSSSSSRSDSRSPSLSSDEQSALEGSLETPTTATAAWGEAPLAPDTPENLVLALLDSVTASKRQSGSCAEILLDDFMLTHPIFLSADKLQQVLLKEYPSHNATPRPDVCHSQGGGGNFLLCACVVQDLARYPELVEEVLKLQRWTEILQDQALEESDSKKPVRPLFRHFRRVDACLQPREAFRGSDESESRRVPLPEEIHWSPGDSRLHDMSAEEVANQLLAFDWELFSCVHEVEFVRYVFRGEEARWRPLNLELVLQRCSEVQHWVGTEILQCQSLPKRGQLLRKFIKIAALCKQNQDLLSFLSVVLGLNNPALSRLRQTWEHKVAEMVRTIRRYRSSPPNLDTDSTPSYLQTKAFVRQLQVIDNQNLLFNMSYKLEPKDT
ncbi:Rap guanine nucleotide exchange factor-like 1 [Acipenser ruthenus]|uniref:Rap guanine nucleotide exchange factor-like 1 n=1 Tax=Acipenser ruthenus TaxID=7906 RepID=A0A662YNF2_ACIRT|nr:Rap guanine nucleotide exchange factor-like 1 [Acipenser ruthenus]